MMLEHPVAEAERELRYVCDDLRTMRHAAVHAPSESERVEAQGHAAWLAAQEILDVITLERVRAAHCLHIWVPAGLDPDDARVCARCNAEQASTPEA